MRRLILLIFLLIPAAASAASYSSIYVFGDSLSDPGNIPFASGYKFPPAPYSGTRFSNGPVAVQYLAPLLGLPVDNSRNYAQGGATTGFVNVLNANSGGLFPGSTLTGVRGQVNDYLDRNGVRSCLLLPAPLPATRYPPAHGPPPMT